MLCAVWRFAVFSFGAAPPPGLFTRSNSAPKTVPPPLPTLAKSSLSSSQSISNPSLNSRFSTSHSRHSSASSLAPVDEDRYATDDRPPPLTIEETKEPTAIREEGEDEEEGEEEEEEGEAGEDGHLRPNHEEKTPDDAGDKGEDDDDDVDDEEEEEEDEDEGEHGEEEEGEDEVEDVQPVSSMARLSGGDIPASPLSVSRAFAIFGREIRHVSPNPSLSLSSLPPPPPSTFSKKTPRTVPPPLPILSTTPGSPPRCPLPACPHHPLCHL